MIVTITGFPGSGKSTLGKGIAKALGFKHYSAGDFLRQISKEMGMSLMQIQQEMEKNTEIDLELDKRTEKVAGKEDNFVIDGRMAWHFVPKSIKIFVKVERKRLWQAFFFHANLFFPATFSSIPCCRFF